MLVFRVQTVKGADIGVFKFSVQLQVDALRPSNFLNMTGNPFIFATDYV